MEVEGAGLTRRGAGAEIDLDGLKVETDRFKNECAVLFKGALDDERDEVEATGGILKVPTIFSNPPPAANESSPFFNLFTFAKLRRLMPFLVAIMPT